MNLVHDPATQRSACTALDALLEILQDVIDQYLNLIMEQLANLLDTAPISIKSVVTGAIGSAAHASKGKFLPYFQPTMNRLQHFLILTGEGEEIELRGIAMDAVGTFAEAVGADAFRPYFADMMKQGFQGLEMGSPRLRECSFLFFAVMARVFGEEFAPYLPNVVPPLLASCRLAEHGEETEVSRESRALLKTVTHSSPSALQFLERRLLHSHLALLPLPRSQFLILMQMAWSKWRWKTSTLTRCSKSTVPLLSRRKSPQTRLAHCSLQLAITSSPTLNNVSSNLLPSSRTTTKAFASQLRNRCLSWSGFSTSLVTPRSGKLVLPW